jgi:hypothetical protein
MQPISRRQFLRWLAACSGAVAAEQFLAACSRAGIPTPVDLSTEQASPIAATATTSAGAPESHIPQGSPTDTSTAAPTDSAREQTSLPDLVVARGAEPELAVTRALAALGGMERFVPPGANVIIKPNICVAYHSYEYAATTNPWVVAALVKLCFQAGAKSVRVMDNPFGGTAEEAYAVSGIEEQVRAAVDS